MMVHMALKHAGELQLMYVKNKHCAFSWYN